MQLVPLRPGVPSHRKWIWVSRDFYMQLEPGWLAVISAGILKPIVSIVDVQVGLALFTTLLLCVKTPVAASW
jgi:hypothetical protein